MGFVIFVLFALALVGAFMLHPILGIIAGVILIFRLDPSR